MAIQIDNGITRDETATGVQAGAVILFVSLALYNVVELNFIILATFKRRAGLYFWSFVVSTWAIAPYASGFLLKALSIAPKYIMLYITMIVVGWCGMVTGQSLVLWSRLHLVLHNNTRLRLVLAIIIVDAILLHTPIAVMIYGTNSNSPDLWVLPYSVFERFQITVFFVQELVLSGLYISETTKLLRLERGFNSGSRQRIMTHLIWVNVIIVLLDATIVGLEYAGLYGIQTTYKAFAYSVKLKLEFSILNRLVELAKNRNETPTLGSNITTHTRTQPGPTEIGVGDTGNVEVADGSTRAPEDRGKGGRSRGKRRRGEVKADIQPQYSEPRLDESVDLGTMLRESSSSSRPS